MFIYLADGLQLHICVLSGSDELQHPSGRRSPYFELVLKGALQKVGARNSRIFQERGFCIGAFEQINK